MKTKKEEYLVERFEELALREENMNVNVIEINLTKKDCREGNEKEFQKKHTAKKSKITSFFKKN